MARRGGGEGVTSTSWENSEEDEGGVARVTQVLAELSWALKEKVGFGRAEGRREEAG